MIMLDIQFADAAEGIAQGWAKGWASPPRLSVWQWADQHRILPRETSKEPGPWKTARNPPLQAIMESISPHSGAEQVTFVAGTQIGKTECGTNFTGYVIDHDPATIVVVEPTSNLGKVWRRQRFDPLIELTPAVGQRIGPRRSRDTTNTLESVKFPGGWLIVAHAESAASLSMYSARYLFLDEVDSYPLDTGGEGDPLDTVKSRADSFGRMRKIFAVSSPKKIMGSSIIWREYLHGDQRECYVPCPHCDHYQVLQDEQLLPTGEYLCEHCGKAIPHSAKTDMLIAHQWRAKYPDRTAHHSYRLPSHYAPIGLGRTWRELYDERQDAGDDPKRIKAYVSRRCAIPYESEEGKIEAADLRQCKEDWAMREIPHGCLLLGAAVDCQSNRLEAQIIGFGRGPQIYIIDYATIPGSPLEADTWAAMDDYLSRPITNSYGIDLLPKYIAIDSGNWAQEVYAACYVRKAKGWIAIKGANTRTAPLIGQLKRHEFTHNGKIIKTGTYHHMIGTNTAKDTLLGRLAMLPKQRKADRWFHLPRDLPDFWFDHMTAERKDPEKDTWTIARANARNEALDVSVYAWAAAHLVNTHRLGHLREKDWTRIEAQIQPPIADLFATQTNPDQPRDLREGFKTL
jgi:phage terminase large subunit GpA-like protein